MKNLVKSTLLACILLARFEVRASAQTPTGDLKSKVDSVISKAYESASAVFPCKLKAVKPADSKKRMLKWQDVSKCLNAANDAVDWPDISRQLREIRKNFSIPANDLSGIVESSLSAHAIPYNKVFVVKREDVLLPLSSSLLKFLPEGSLENLPVFEKGGSQVGTFSGVYSFEKSGGLSGNIAQHRLFQYTDREGKTHGSPDKLLLDSFGVPWKDSVPQPGFRLPADKIALR
jgi:hypothetical protein